MNLIPAMNADGYIPVRAVYSPHLTSTLIGENCLMGPTRADQDKYEYQGIQKFLSQSTFLITCTHKYQSSHDIQVGGILIDGKWYTHSLIALDLDA